MTRRLPGDRFGDLTLRAAETDAEVRREYMQGNRGIDAVQSAFWRHQRAPRGAHRGPFRFSRSTPVSTFTPSPATSATRQFVIVFVFRQSGWTTKPCSAKCTSKQKAVRTPFARMVWKLTQSTKLNFLRPAASTASRAA